MAWITQICRFGHSHECWSQERDNACGPSCMMMAYERIWKNKIPDEKLMYEAYNKYGNDSEDATESMTDGTEYTNAMNLSTMASKFIGRSEVHMSKNFQSLADDIIAGVAKGKPVMGLVRWQPSGGHFVLIDAVTNISGDTWLCVCDPWDQQVRPIRVQRKRPIPYTPQYGLQVKEGIEFPAGKSDGLFGHCKVQFAY